MKRRVRWQRLIRKEEMKWCFNRKSLGTKEKRHSNREFFTQSRADKRASRMYGLLGVVTRGKT